MTVPFSHRSVLRDEVVQALTADRHVRWIVDMTAGGGGHSEALLDAAPEARLLALDRDPRAVKAARERLARFEGRASVRQERFSALQAVLAREHFGEPDGAGGQVDAIVLDAGVSSPQLDDPGRGFSFRESGPLDMRMGGEGVSLADFLDRTTEEDLARVFREYGEIRKARRLARAILEERAAGRLEDTATLASLCERVLHQPGPPPRIHLATLPFQALRIAVNDELGELETAMDAIPACLSVGGRAAVISFHSLEDRLVKQRFRTLSRPPAIPRGLPVREAERKVYFKEVGRLVRPDEDECASNPRARSARMRVLERTGAEP